MAQKELKNNEVGELVKFLTFFVGKEIYGIPVEKVKEAVEYTKVFKIPRCGTYIRGVINLRGDVIPVIDLGMRFYEQPLDITINSSIIFVEMMTRTGLSLIGVMIDQVDSVLDISEKEMSQVPDFGIKIRPDFIKKIGKSEEDFIILLDINAILNIDELAEIDFNDDVDENVQ